MLEEEREGCLGEEEGSFAGSGKTSVLEISISLVLTNL
jgi:hypothetical protein